MSDPESGEVRRRGGGRVLERGKGVGRSLVGKERGRHVALVLVV